MFSSHHDLRGVGSLDAEPDTQRQIPKPLHFPVGKVFFYRLFPVARGYSSRPGEFSRVERSMRRAHRYEGFHVGEFQRSNGGGQHGETVFLGAFQGVLPVIAPGAGTAVAEVIYASGQGWIQKGLQPDGHVLSIGG